MPRRNPYRGPHRRGERGGPRRALRTLRALESQQGQMMSNPGSVPVPAILIGSVVLAGAIYLIARPNLPGTFDDSWWGRDSVDSSAGSGAGGEQSGATLPPSSSSGALPAEDAPLIVGATLTLGA